MTTPTMDDWRAAETRWPERKEAVQLAGMSLLLHLPALLLPPSRSSLFLPLLLGLPTAPRPVRCSHDHEVTAPILAQDPF